MMTSRALMMYVGMSSLVFVGFYFGYRFLKLKNDLLGYEWFLLGTSAFNNVLFLSGTSEFSGQVVQFLDLFGRFVGVPIIGGIGLMRVTHGLNLPKVLEKGLFVAGLIATYLLLVWGDSLQTFLAFTLMIVGIFFLAILIFMARQSWQKGLKPYAAAVVLIIGLNIFTGLLRDFVHLPDEATAIFFNEFVLEHAVWSFSFTMLYFAYRNLGRAKALVP